jgi:hypothetical protein
MTQLLYPSRMLWWPLGWPPADVGRVAVRSSIAQRPKVLSDSPDGQVANAIAVEIVVAEGVGQAATKASGGTAQAR